VILKNKFAWKNQDPRHGPSEKKANKFAHDMSHVCQTTHVPHAICLHQYLTNKIFNQLLLYSHSICTDNEDFSSTLISSIISRKPYNSFFYDKQMALHDQLLIILTECFSSNITVWKTFLIFRMSFSVEPSILQYMKIGYIKNHIYSKRLTWINS
jgi:hypothetical protein